MNRIWYCGLRALRRDTRRLLEERIGGPGEIFRAPRETLAACGLKPEELELVLRHDTSEAEDIIACCEAENIGILTLQDAGYPERLRNIPDPPGVLYIRGRLPDIDSEAAIAVVGTRNCTPYGEQISRNMGYGLAAGGALVVTGLAGGCDSIAATGALMAGGRVVGVLGTAIDVVYPAWNVRLYEDVAASGALVSEYPPGAVTDKSSFPIRNRIIAGLSLGVVVTEAPKRSGALITASRALDYGRDVFAVPGNVDAAASRGSNGLLHEGATVCTGAGDVLREYESLFPGKLRSDLRTAVPQERHIPSYGVADAEDGDSGKPRARKKASVRRHEPEEQPPAQESGEAAVPAEPESLRDQLGSLSETQLKIVSVMTKPQMHIDDIIDLSGLPASAVLTEMTLLQIKGVVSQESGKRFSLKITKRG